MCAIGPDDISDAIASPRALPAGSADPPGPRDLAGLNPDMLMFYLPVAA
jgi:hypothetical protein